MKDYMKRDLKTRPVGGDGYDDVFIGDPVAFGHTKFRNNERKKNKRASRRRMKQELKRKLNEYM